MKGTIVAGVLGLGTLISSPARANLILVGPEVLGGSGFGAQPRALTQSHGPGTTSESGCIAPYLFALDAVQQAIFNADVSSFLSDVFRIALDSTISFNRQSGGPESDAFVDLETSPPKVAPEPSTVILLGSGLVGLGLWGWQRRMRP